MNNARRFKTALSFPGEYRDLVEDIAGKLAIVFGKEEILYDKYHRAEFARPNLDIHLQKLYRDESDLVIVFICAHYQRKKWCGIEWRAIRDLLNQRDTDERIMFIKCGNGSVEGVFGTIDGYIDSSEVQTADIVNDIVKRCNTISQAKGTEHQQQLRQTEKNVTMPMKQIHFGEGDNVGENKIIYN